MTLPVQSLYALIVGFLSGFLIGLWLIEQRFSGSTQKRKRTPLRDRLILRFRKPWLRFLRALPIPNEQLTGWVPNTSAERATFAEGSDKLFNDDEQDKGGAA